MSVDDWRVYEGRAYRLLQARHIKPGMYMQVIKPGSSQKVDREARIEQVRTVWGVTCIYAQDQPHAAWVHPEALVLVGETDEERGRDAA